MKKFRLCNSQFGLPETVPFRRYRMNHIRNMVFLLFFAVFTNNKCYKLNEILCHLKAPIGAVNSVGSRSDHHEHETTNSDSEKSHIIWSDRLLQSLVFIWTESDPTTEGHAERMFQMWSSNPSQYPPMSKKKLYQIAQQFVVEGKIPFHRGKVVQREHSNNSRITQRDPDWSTFTADADKFLTKFSKGKMKLQKPMCNIFIEQHPEYAHRDWQAMSKYMYNERFRRGETRRDRRGPSSKQPSQASVYQHFGASSSQIPQINPHPQGYYNPYQSQHSYVDYAHGEMFSSMPQLPQHIQSHSPDQLHQGDSGYYHGESSSQIPRLRLERPATSRLDLTSCEYKRKKCNRTRNQSGSSTPQGDDDDLDLDLHL